LIHWRLDAGVVGCRQSPRQPLPSACRSTPEVTQTQEDSMPATNGDPRHHVEKMKDQLQKTIHHLRDDVTKVDDPQFKALFETSAEVLSGLVKAFNDYERKNEAAWRR
jgi:hypothetical protein